MVVWDDAKEKPAFQIPVVTSVRSVKLSRSHVVLVLSSSVRVYRFQSPPELTAVFETAPNPDGLCCLTSKILVFPGRTPGQVQKVELSTGSVSIIPAHASSLRALDVSRDGTLLATASSTVCWFCILAILSKKLISSRVPWSGYFQRATVRSWLNYGVASTTHRFIRYHSPHQVSS